MEGAGVSEPPAERAAHYLRAQFRLGSTAAFVFWGVVALLAARYGQRSGPEAPGDLAFARHWLSLALLAPPMSPVASPARSTAKRSSAKATSGARLRREHDALAASGSI